MKKLALVLFGLFVAQAASPVFARADLLQLEPGTGTIEGVAISKGGKATVADRNYVLTTVGAGLRSKKKLGINFRVYVAQLLVSDATKFVRTDDGAAASIDSMTAAGIQLSFLRGVDASTVQESFQEALTANSVDLSNPAVKAFLDAVAAGGDAESGKALSIVGEKLPGNLEVITYQDTNGKAQTIQGAVGLVKSIFSIWLGVPSDNGVANLKKAILNGSSS